eukprot:7686089-Karenia_brevis.AAC.1
MPLVLRVNIFLMTVTWMSKSQSCWTHSNGNFRLLSQDDNITDTECVRLSGVAETGLVAGAGLLAGASLVAGA